MRRGLMTRYELKRECRCFVESIEQRFEASEGRAHAYHYGAYERSALRRVAAGDAELEENWSR